MSPFTLKIKETLQWMEKTNPKWSEKSVQFGQHSLISSYTFNLQLYLSLFDLSFSNVLLCNVFQSKVGVEVSKLASATPAAMQRIYIFLIHLISVEHKQWLMYQSGALQVDISNVLWEMSLVPVFSTTYSIILVHKKPFY